MEDNLQKIPHNSDAEKSLLGGLIYSPDSFEDIIDILKPDDFYEKENELIFFSMLELYKSSRTIDPVLISEEIKKIKKFNIDVVEARFAQILREITNSYNLMEYAEIIKEKSVLRKLGKIGTRVVEIAYKDDRSSSEIIDEAESLVSNLSDKVSKNSVVSLAEATMNEMKRLDHIVDNKGVGLLGLETHFTELDFLTNGLNKSDLIIIAARPAMGKTAFALNLALNSAVKSKKSVLIFSLEMSVEQLYQRLLAMHSEVPLKNIRTGHLEDKMWNKIGVSIPELSSAKINIADIISANTLSINSLARKMKKKENIDLIIIDYLQLLSMGGKKSSENRQQEISEISRALKQLARELNIPIVALSQLSRGVESRTDKRPMLSDLRESGAIEQDADIVMFLYRDEYYNPDTVEKGITELIIGKHRNGATGTIKLEFKKEFTKFKNHVTNYN